MKAALVGEAVFLFSGSSVVAFKFPRELASREFIEKLGEKHGRGEKKNRQQCLLIYEDSIMGNQ